MAWADRTITIIGAGIGGLALAAALRMRGIDVEIYEQAPAFARVGSGIQMSPNAMRVLRGLGLEDKIRANAFQPTTWDNRDWNTGASTNRAKLGQTVEERYGAPYIQMHRGDLHEFLASAVPDEIIRFNKKLARVEEGADGYRLSFEDGTHTHAETLIGADGVHSLIRQHLLGAEAPRFMGCAAYRTTFPSALLGEAQVDDSTKWWGIDRHIVIYFTTKNRDEIYFTTKASIRKFKPCWRLAPGSTNGPCSNATRCRNGLRVELACWATPAIRCYPIWPRALRLRWRTRWCWLAA
jgi:6-hydroxynicotinate 3-monooxygenase